MSYTGDKTCREVWDTLTSQKNAALIDVRTAREWETIGIPDLSSIEHQVVFAEWQVAPSMELNSEFTQQVIAALDAAGLQKQDPLFFLCRTGVRSQGAASALAAAGFENTFNILDGFEGPPNEEGNRGTVKGWQSDDLPWKRET